MDIRNYFSVKSSKNVRSATETKPKESEPSKMKKKRAIIDSDSDEEVPPPKKKTSPTGSKKTKLENNRVIAGDIFGCTPVQRTVRKFTNKSPDTTDDSELIQALQNVAESEWDTTDTLHETNDSRASAEKSNSAFSSKEQRDSSKHNAHAEASLFKRDNASHELHVSPKHCPPKKLKTVSVFTENNPSLPGQHIEMDNRKIKVEKSKPDSIQNQSSKLSSQSSNQVAQVQYQSRQYISSNPLSNVTPAVSNLWVDKYKPASLKQIIGQQGENSNVQKLLRWLSAWYSNHGPGIVKKLAKPSPWSRDDSGAFFKAALLSGPPGVGKTTTAHLVCKELGMDVVEFNASDTRSKKLMNQEVTELLSSMTLLPFFQSGGDSKTSAKHALVMDEVDGMAGNEDRGGVQELINLIKNSKCPVICMCNDRNHPKIRSLANYCFDLKFCKPRIEQIRGALMSVCFKEKVQITAEALNEVIVGTNHDIRQALHNLSMWSAVNKKMSAEQTKSDANTAKKMIKLGPWDTVRKIFSAEERLRMSLAEKSDLFFNDYNIMPLFVQENYLIVSPNVSKKNETLRQIARAAASISYGDLVEKTIRSRNDAWNLLPVEAVFACVVPGDIMEGRLTAQIQFPAWLGKNSTYGKMNRLLQELHVHMRLSISGGKQAVNLEYIHSISNAIVNPLVQNGAAGVPEALKMMEDYHLTLSDLESLFELCQWSGQPHPMIKVESKVKAALTRTYNKSGIMTPYSLEARVSKRRGASTTLDEESEPLEGDEKELGNDSSSDETPDAMIKKKKQEKSGTTGKATASSSRESPRGSRGGRGRSSGTTSRGRGRGKKGKI